MFTTGAELLSEVRGVICVCSSVFTYGLICLDMDGSSEHVRACAVHGDVPDRAGFRQPGSRRQGGWGEIRMSALQPRVSLPRLLVSISVLPILCFQEPCIEEHCHDSWFPGTNLLSNLHHVINFVRVRVPETAPEVKREAPPSTSTEASSYGQVRDYSVMSL